MKKYTKINALMFDKWVEEGWKWGIPITLDEYLKAQKGNWDMQLTPNKFVPKEWFGNLKGKKVLGLASGGAQQMPIFKALGADVVCLDFSSKQLESELNFSKMAGYDIKLVKYDMTDPLPFEDETFDLTISSRSPLPL